MSNEFKVSCERDLRWVFAKYIENMKLIRLEVASYSGAEVAMLSLRDAKALSAALTSFIGKLEQEAGIVGEHTELP